MFFRTDLAVEGEEASRTAPPEEERGGCRITLMELRGEQARRCRKPEGRYITVELPPFSDHIDGDNQFLDVVAGELRALLPEEGLVLAAGLGNRAITPDALGPKAMESVLATRHIVGELSRITGEGSLRAVAAVSPNVLGNTGMETLEILQGLCGKLRPSAVVAVDALAARSVRRLGRTVQLSDAGIAPGAGIGNTRPQLSEKTLGIPVIGLGVPTVVDASTLLFDLLEDTGASFAELREKIEPHGAQMVVTPREIDLLIGRAARLLGMSINLALNPCFSVEEFTALVQ